MIVHIYNQKKMCRGHKFPELLFLQETKSSSIWRRYIEVCEKKQPESISVLLSLSTAVVINCLNCYSCRRLKALVYGENI